MDYQAFWGKAGQSDTTTPTYHLLTYHCLDVAAVGQALLRQRDDLAKCLSSIAGCKAEDLKSLITYFLGLHDCGKFSDRFQDYRPDIVGHLQQDRGGRTRFARIRHDEAGHRLFCGKLLPTIARQPEYCCLEPNVLKVLSQPFLWHHGSPRSSGGSTVDDYFSSPSIMAASHFFKDMATLLCIGDLQMSSMTVASSRYLSWWLAGLTVLCDWIGSNTDYFPMTSEVMPIEKYWSLATDQAEKAIELSGLLSKKPGDLLSLHQLVVESGERQCSPRPLQQSAARAVTCHGPQLFILEDVPGSGKTEAALMLANRMMLQGTASGMYFALPTMATANAMYHRILHVYRKFFSDTARPSLVLAHSGRQMVEAFRLSVQSSEYDRYGDQTDSAEAICSAWLADNRKKALLSDFGVGTIDQALLAVLAIKHQALRLLGLVGKVLVVDEVHACDAYVSELLRKLLHLHARAGGSAILLSATLPSGLKRELVQSFCSGLGKTNDLDIITANDHYPLLTQASARGVRLDKIKRSALQRRTVDMKLLDDTQSAIEHVVNAARSGRCACWIRNTVADARTAFDLISKRRPKLSPALFHARLAMCDRLVIEQDCQDRFGPGSVSDSRRGQILIATQVVEQSLDLDFDAMVSDLAPIDLIIQRSGRLCRHRRDNSGNRKDGADERGQPTMHVLGPRFTDDPDPKWYSRVFPKGAYVYQDVGQLWLTARLLKSREHLTMPDDVREWIESVYCKDVGAQIPTSLQPNNNQVHGQLQAARSIAKLNQINFRGGYGILGADTVWSEEDLAPTRLGDPTITVYLARWDGNRLRPWYHGKQDYGWARGSLSVRKNTIAAEAPSSNIDQAEVNRCHSELPAGGKWAVLLPLEEQSGGYWTGQAKNISEETCQFWYHKHLGLMTEAEHQEMERT